MNRIGERIRKRREYLNISLNTLAKGVGVSSSLLSQIENSKASPSLHTIKHIADYLNTSVSTLIGENEIILENPVLRWEEKKLIKSGRNANLYSFSNYSSKQTLRVYMLELNENGTSEGLFEEKKRSYEYCFVIKGKVTIHLNNTGHELEKKGSISYYSQDFQSIENMLNCTSIVLLISSEIMT